MMNKSTLTTVLYMISSLAITPIIGNAAIRSNPPHRLYAPADTSIILAIKGKYASDKLLIHNKISVATNQGIVGLSGEVISKTAYQQAIRLAESTPGVKDVNTNALMIKGSKTPLADMAITAKIQGKILQDKLFSDKQMAYWGFNVETHEHVVLLSGKVHSDAIKSNVEQIAKSTQGVKSVKNTLQVIA